MRICSETLKFHLRFWVCWTQVPGFWVKIRPEWGARAKCASQHPVFMYPSCTVPVSTLEYLEIL